MNAMIVDTRLRTMYNSMLRNDFANAIRIVKRTLFEMNHAKDVRFEKPIRARVENKLYAILILMAVRQYDLAHQHIRDLHFDITM